MNVNTDSVPLNVGDRLVARSQVEVKGLVHWRAPMTSDLSGTVPAGTVVEVKHEPGPSASVVYCWPIDYDAVAELLIPSDERDSLKYDGYGLVIHLAEIGGAWSLLDSLGD